MLSTGNLLILKIGFAFRAPKMKSWWVFPMKKNTERCGSNSRKNNNKEGNMPLINIEVNHSNLTKKKLWVWSRAKLVFCNNTIQRFFLFLKHFMKVQYVVCVEIYLQWVWIKMDTLNTLRLWASHQPSLLSSLPPTQRGNPHKFQNHVISCLL